MRRRNLVIGAVLLGAYLVVLAMTVGLRSEHVRPLYDGFAPPPPYQWVEPPSFFASGNVEPKAVTATVRLNAEGSVPAGIATPDGQFVLNLGRAAITPRSGASSVKVKITPVAPSTLPHVPTGPAGSSALRPNGNAYLVTMTYGTGNRVHQLAHPGTAVIEIPELGTDLFYGIHDPGVNGPPWAQLEATPVPPRRLSLTTAFDRPGYYLAGTNLPELVGSDESSGGNAVLIGIGTAALAVVVLAVALVLVRHRRRRAMNAA